MEGLLSIYGSIRISGETWLLAYIVTSMVLGNAEGQDFFE